MKQNAGIVTALAVVLALFGISNLPKGSSGTGAASTQQGERGVKPPTKTTGNSTFSYACGQIQERIQPLMADNPDQAWRVPSFCYPNPAAIGDPVRTAPETVTFAIASAPHPISTHLPMLFDRIVEIIEQAAQDNNYSYDSSWLPWNETKSYNRFPDLRAAQLSQSDDEKQPGVLVFRNSLKAGDDSPYKRGLVVFLVSELPTGGINREQFNNALGWIELLKGPAPTGELKILGPSFSGSLPSLYRSIQECKSKSAVCRNKIHVSSGSVSSDSSYRWFKERFSGDPLVTFDTALEGDCRVLNRFVTYVSKKQHYDVQHIAILSEDETAFGGGVYEKDTPATPDKRKSEDAGGEACVYDPELTYLYYPRDIATLRSAYEQQSIFNSSKQAAGNNSNTSATTLRGDLSEPANSEHDTVRTYGGQLTPLAQESVLLNITDVLKARKIQFVVLRSTNTLDQIFLSQFLRRSYPDARIVIDGADLLFRRGAEGASLRGVMVLSTYPLLTWQQDWTSIPPKSTGGSFRIFGQDVAVGLYIAARELFVPDGQSPSDISTVEIANYAPPAWARANDNSPGDERPATWLTVIGHRQFWPVAVLNSFTIQHSEPNSLLPTKSERKDCLIAISGEPHPMWHLPVEFWTLIVLTAAWGCVHLLWCAHGSISPLPAPFRLTYFAPVPRSQHAALIAFGSWVVAAFAIAVAAASGLFRWELASWNWVIVVWIVVVLLLAYFACVKNYELPPMTNVDFTPLDATLSRQRATRGFAWFLVAFGALEVALVLRLNIANAIPAFWRSVHLLSGVSALVPQLILLAGMYSWFWFNLRGLALFGDDRPLLPRKADLKLADDTPVLPVFSRELAGDPAEIEALPIGRRYFGILVWICPGVVLVCMLVLQDFYLRTIGERTFGISIFFWLTLCIAIVVTDTVQCWMAWRRLRDLLVYLDRIPLRRTLYALQGLSWSSVWAMSGNVLTERYCLISRQLEAMRHLANRLNDWVPPDTADVRTRDTLVEKIVECQKTKLKKLITWYESLDGAPVKDVEALREVQEEFAAIAAMVAGIILAPAWQTESDSLIFGRALAKSADSVSRSAPVLSPNIQPHVLAAEEFFVLPYVGFIQNILGRIRTIVLGSLFLFVATTLAVSSYPFDPLPVLGGIFLATFVIVGSTMIVIYAGMHRDATLSYITGSEPGELGGQFWRQLITFGIGPLLGLLTTLFPSITDFVVSWLQPSTQAIK